MQEKMDNFELILFLIELCYMPLVERHFKLLKIYINM